MMESILEKEMTNYNSPMNLAAKARGEKGYAMAALLVAMSVMAIMMSVAMPTWSQMIRRDKEEELIFRGTQYARAINQYQRKFANASPASLDVLIEQRMLRKKFKDPLSPNKDGEFQLLYLQNQATTGLQGPAPFQGQGQSGQQSGSRGAASRGGGAQTGAGMGGSIGPSPSGRGAIVGVASKNTGQSIKTYKGKDHYNEWQFIGMEMSVQAGAGAGGRGPQRGGQGGREGGMRQGGGREGGTSFTTPDGRLLTPPPGGPPRGGPSRQGR